MASRKTSAIPALNRIEPSDLASLDRTLDLYRAAVRAGWTTASEADRLRFVAAAVHARGIGTSNPPGLFRSIVQGRRWHLLTQLDEDRARAGLRNLTSTAAAPIRSEDRAALLPRRRELAEPFALATLLDRFAPRFGPVVPAAVPPAVPRRQIGRLAP